MRFHNRPLLFALAALCSGVAVRNAAAQPKYTITDLGTLGGIYSVAYGVNNSGHVTGFSELLNTSGIHAFYYDGQMHDLGATPVPPNSDTFSVGMQINNSDQIVGSTLDPTANFTIVFLWDAQRGMRSPLSNANGMAINNAGQIAGEGNATAFGQEVQAFFWDATTGVQWLPLFQSCTRATGEGVNDSGTVVGYCQVSSNSYQAFVWDNIHGIQTLAPGTTESFALAINNEGHIVGSVTNTLGVSGAVEWTGPGAMQFLPLILDQQGNTLTTEAYSINNQGDIVGIATGSTPGSTAALWVGSTGYRLDDLIPANSGWHLIQANGISDHGQIVGYGLNNADGQTHAFLLNPVTDNTAPVIVPQITGTLGNNGWYRSSVTINWSVSDPESGIASTSGCDPTTLTADTPGITLTCSATNGAGLSASVSVTIKIDKTPPVISGMPAAGCSLWPPNGKPVQVASVTAADALSGIAPASFKVTGTSNAPGNGGIVISGGPNKFLVQLEADKDRIYNLNATASDAAGNTVTKQAICTVPHDQGN